MSSERQIIKEFIEIYRSEPALWQSRSVHYNNRAIKSKAYARMVAKLQELYPNADIEVVKRKINALRTNYRKEQKKVLASKERSLVTGEPVYVPSLWYYELFSFIGDQDNDNSPAHVFDGDIDDCNDLGDDEFDEHEFDGDEYGEFGEELDESLNADYQKNSAHIYDNSYTRLPQKRPHPYTYKSDEADDRALCYPKPDGKEAFGLYVASKLKDMDKQNQVLAEMLISEVLFRGETGTLTAQTVILNRGIEEVGPTTSSADVAESSGNHEGEEVLNLHIV